MTACFPVEVPSTGHPGLLPSDYREGSHLLLLLSETTRDIAGLGPFTLAGQSVKQDWILLGLDFDYRISEDLTLTSGVFTSTSGQDPTIGSSLGLRMSF